MDQNAKDRNEFLGKAPPLVEEPYVEKNDLAIRKFLSGIEYNAEDVEKEVKLIFETRNYSYDNFFFLKNVNQFEEVFQNVQLVRDEVLFCILDKNENQWVLFGLVKRVEVYEETVVWYKDPCGQGMSEFLSARLKERFPNVQIDTNNRKELDTCREAKHFGPLVLRNLIIFMKAIENNKEMDEKVFNCLQFTTIQDLVEIRLKKVSGIVDELKGKGRFKEALRKFLKELPLELSTQMADYQEEISNATKDAKHIDHNKFDQARKDFLPDEDALEKLMKKHKISEHEDIKDKKLDIQKEWEHEMEQLRAIFIILDQVKAEDKLKNSLLLIARALSIEYDTLLKFYDSKLHKDAPLKLETIETVDLSSIETKTNPKKVCANCTSLDGILNGMRLSKDPSKSEPSRAVSDEKGSLKTKYQSVKEFYEQYKNNDKYFVNTWARGKKGRLGTTDKDICEAIAIMDRAYEIMKGYNFRIPQILSVLVFLHGNDRTGRLCEIQTGEGKTTIVSVLAAIKCLQGNKIDVITSNPVLATESWTDCKEFYAMLNLTTATNNTDQAKVCYTADVLYGCISSYQFDYLRERSEGLDVRKGRKFDVVIMDEVDSMLIDNGGQIAKLASPFPGMECLRYIYIQIWNELNKAEKAVANETTARLKEIDQMPENVKDKMMEEYLEEVTIGQKQKIQEMIKSAKPHKLPFTPHHLESYIDLQLDKWIKNAIYAKYNCHKDKQYTITDGKIAPVDYLNTGITLKNTIWSHGLHQFIQLKEQKELTFETMTSCFMSNIGYIKKYRDKDIFGMTGTLGSTAEQNLLAGIYNINFAKLPTYVEKDFRELPGCVFADDCWETEVALKILEQIDDDRSVLAILETVSDVNAINAKLVALQKNATNSFTILRYANEEDAKKKPKKLNIRHIILATNIAGRGTNFKTEDALEENGGLHVFVCFLPCNLRVEGQAFGRTSRQGKKGTAQLLLRGSEASELGAYGDEPKFEHIKKQRDKEESDRLRRVKEVLLPELNFMDALYEKFAKMYRDKADRDTSRRATFVLRDLKESWSFWLREKDFKFDNIKDTNVEDQFKQFEVQVRISLHDNKIVHNPLNALGLANYYMEVGDFSSALIELNEVCSGGGGLAGVNLKLFEAHVKNGSQMMEKFKKAMADTFFIPFEKNEEYKHKARENLERAREALLKEIDYIKTYIQSESSGVSDIIYEEDNPITKAINSRLASLEILYRGLDELYKEVKTYDGFDIKGMTQLKRGEIMKGIKDQAGKDRMEKVLVEETFNELPASGIDILYAIRQIPDVDQATIAKSRRQILVGITALTIGIAWPPAFSLMLPIATSLIPEGIIDIIMALISNAPLEEGHSANLLKKELFSYGKAALSFGLAAIKQSVIILKKAISICHKLSDWLRNCQFLPGLCNKLANFVDKIAFLLEKQLEAVQFARMASGNQLAYLRNLQGQAGKAEIFQHLGGMDKIRYLEKFGDLHKRSQMFVAAMHEIGVAIVRLGQATIVEQVVVPAVTEYAKEKIIELIRQKVDLYLGMNGALLIKLRKAPEEEILKVLDEFVNAEKISALAGRIAKNVTEHLGANSKLVDLVTTAMQMIATSAELLAICDAVQIYLSKHLRDKGHNNDVRDIRLRISAKVAERIFSLIYDLFEAGKKMYKYGVEIKKWKKGDEPLFTLDKKKAKDAWLNSGEKLTRVVCRKQTLMIMEDERMSDFEKRMALATVKTNCAVILEEKKKYDKKRDKEIKTEEEAKKKKKEEEKRDTEIFEIV